jgi:hypothetical protein
MDENILNGEQLVSLNQAAAILPGHVHVSTVRRYHLYGLHGVRLETVLIAGKRWTSREALGRFVLATQTRKAVAHA